MEGQILLNLQQILANASFPLELMMSEVAVCSLLRLYICCSKELKKTVARRNLVVNKHLTHLDVSCLNIFFQE